jgi:GTPase
MPSFGKLGSMFFGDMMRQEIEEVEIKSAKGRSSNSVSGAGQTQLEIEKFRLRLRESKIKKELENSNLRAQHLQTRKIQKHNSMPLIAVVGYTNAGKSALINFCCNSDLESVDRLFQTLTCTQKQLRMPDG